MQTGDGEKPDRYGHTHFLGLSGQFYVAHCLTRRGFHAAITLGNAPNVDIIVAHASGSAALSIQVKTSTDACGKHFGKEAGEWRVSRSVFRWATKNLWYALVDMPMDCSKNPVVFIVPSLWIAGFLKLQMTDAKIRSQYPTVCTRAEAFYYLVKDLWPCCKERWDRIGEFLQNGVLPWCESCPDSGRDWKDKHRWGKCVRSL